MNNTKTNEEILNELFYENLKITPDTFRNLLPSEYGFTPLRLNDNLT